MTSRCATIGGPATVVVGSMGTFVPRGDVRVRLRPETARKSNALLGTTDHQRVGTEVRVIFQPVGLGKYLDWVYPSNAGNIGEDLCGCEDDELVISGRDGVTLRCKAVARIGALTVNIGRAPDGMFGDMEFGAVVANETDLAVLDSLMEMDSGNDWQMPADAANRNLDLIATSILWGDIPLQDADGIRFTGTYTAKKRTDGRGNPTGWRLTDVSAQMSFTPTGMTLADLRNLIHWDGPGAVGLQDDRRDLVLTAKDPAGDEVTIALYSASISAADLAWGRGSERIGELTFEAGRSTLSPYHAFLTDHYSRAYFQRPGGGYYLSPGEEGVYARPKYTYA